MEYRIPIKSRSMDSRKVFEEVIKYFEDNCINSKNKEETKQYSTYIIKVDTDVKYIENSLLPYLLSEIRNKGEVEIHFKKQKY